MGSIRRTTSKTKKMKEFTRNGITLCFYQAPEDEKYQFIVKGNKPLTQLLLANITQKRISLKDIHYAAQGIFAKIEQNLLTVNNLEEMGNPIIDLAETVQGVYGESIITRVTGKTGPDHNPIVSVEIELPDGRIFSAQGINQRMAKQDAAKKALADLYQTNP